LGPRQAEDAVLCFNVNLLHPAARSTMPTVSDGRDVQTSQGGEGDWHWWGEGVAENEELVRSSSPIS